MRLVPVQDNLDEWWGVLLPSIDSFVESADGRYKHEDVYEGVTSGKIQLWVAMEEHVIEATALSQVIEFPQLNELRVIMCVGEKYENWVHLVQKFEEIATLLKCKISVLEARPGWEKIVKPFGYKKTHVMLEKVL